MDKLEQLAFRLFVRRGLTHAIGTAEESWERSRGTKVFQECMADALAVVEAMRDPTFEMMQAMHEAMFEDKWDGTQAPMIGAGFDAAIDAIIATNK